MKHAELYIVRLMLILGGLLVLLQPVYASDEIDIPDFLKNDCHISTATLTIENTVIESLFQQYDLFQRYMQPGFNRPVSDSLINGIARFALYSDNARFLSIELQSASSDLYLSLKDIAGYDIRPINSQLQDDKLTFLFPVQPATGHLLQLEGTGEYTFTIKKQSPAGFLRAPVAPTIIYDASITAPDIQLYPVKIFGADYITISFSGEDSTLYPELLTHCHRPLPVQITDYGRQGFSQVYPIDPDGMFIVVQGNGDYQLQIAAGDTLRENRGDISPDTLTEGRFPDGGEGIASYQFATTSHELQVEITGQSDEIMLHTLSGRLIAPEARFYDAGRGITLQTYINLSDNHYTLSILADFYYEFRILETIETPSEPESEICTVRPYGAVNQRSGPGLTYTVVNVLAISEAFPVSGQAVDDEGYIWWRLEADDTWLRSDVIELTGDCSNIPDISS